MNFACSDHAIQGVRQFCLKLLLCFPVRDAASAAGRATGDARCSTYLILHPPIRTAPSYVVVVPCRSWTRSFIYQAITASISTTAINLALVLSHPPLVCIAFCTSDSQLYFLGIFRFRPAMAQAALISRIGAAQASLGGSLRPVQIQGGRQLSSLFATSSSSSFLPAGLGLRGNVERVGAVKTVALFGSKKAAPAKTPAPKKEKSKVEDGIFGTSGGIGFTKANELFVGRVAMLGFAASILGEALTGKGTLAQFDIETGIPLTETEPLLLFFILFTLLGAIGALGDRGKFVDEAPVAGLDSAIIKPGKGLKGAFGLNERGPVFGFTKANELFVGRLAQLGIAFSIIGEIITGKGTLAQLNIETGVPITELEPLIIFNVIFFLFAAVNPGTGKFVNDDDIEE